MINKAYTIWWWVKETQEKNLFRKAIVKHGDKYDYTKVKYFNSQTKVTIVCPEDGEFRIKPNNHIIGHRCPKCGRIKAQKNIRLDWSEVKERLIKNGNIFEYDESSYVAYTEDLRVV